MKLIRQYKFSLIWILVILILTGFPGQYIPKVGNLWDWLGIDKLAHLILFAVLTYIIMYESPYRHSNKSAGFIVISLVLIFGTLYGLLTEVLQHYVFIGRYAGIYDFLANTLGCILGVVLFMLFDAFRRKKP